MGVLIKIFINFAFIVLASCQFSEFVKWQRVAYKNVPASAPYNFSVNVPFGVAHYKNKLFVGNARRFRGIPSTLNVVELVGSPPHLNPLLIPYPNYKTNELDPFNRADPARIVSVYRPRVDRCDRLWFVDTGLLEYRDGEINVQRPSIWAINLKNDRVLGKFDIPEDIVPTGKGLASITIDDTDCKNTFAYLPDWYNNCLIVFSALQKRIWRFNHNFFHFNPFEGEYSLDGQQFQWSDGLFSVALSQPKPSGFRTAYFHPLGSTTEFTVSTEVLRDESLASRRVHGSDFKAIGRRPPGTQTQIHYFDQKNNVLFFAEIQNNAVSCWSPSTFFTPETVYNVYQNNRTMIYPTDLEIDNESTMWVLANRLPRLIYDQLDYNEFNFNIFRANTDQILMSSPCMRAQTFFP